MDLSENSKKLQKYEKSRKTSFYKRSNGLHKKAYELSTLCDVLICMICYGKDSDQPKTYPENFPHLKSIIKRYQGLSEAQRDKRKTTISSFSTDKKMKKVVEANSGHMSTKESGNKQHPPPRDGNRLRSEKKLREIAGILDGKMKTLREKLFLLKIRKSIQENQSVFPKQHMPKDHQSNMENSRHIQPLASQNLLRGGLAMRIPGQCPNGPKIFGKNMCTAPPSSPLIDNNLWRDHDCDYKKKILSQQLLHQGNGGPLLQFYQILPDGVHNLQPGSFHRSLYQPPL